jgi:hypothetical protein
MLAVHKNNNNCIASVAVLIKVKMSYFFQLANFKIWLKIR